jgi:hypothetical protein
MKYDRVFFVISSNRENPMRYYLENDPSVKEASGIQIRDRKTGEIIVLLQGPYSVACAGTILAYLEEQGNLSPSLVISTFDKYWEGE